MRKRDDTNLDLYLRQKQEHKRARELAGLLMVSMKINPSATYLIRLLSNEPHSTIEEAMSMWVKGELKDYSLDSPTEELLMLLRRRFKENLEQVLNVD
ncbi:MAG: hypothetical protein LC541_10910 [Candidatus Thiodiazotropha sp.]|nr:hypothetical protein [Candidatus Thiodiazotropha sp.]MCM8883785.1 hypothetical protein [Candidatus Thiodiazotropha sp.]MCM8922304.1 hypothetical protein [Candidatus Thiodiazotropha sp.]